MSLIKKPSQLEVTPTLCALIYGNPGIGKSTLALSSPAPVLLDFDGGVNRINGAHQCDTVQIHSWEEALQAVEEIRGSSLYLTLVIDTVGKMLSYMEDYIKRTNPKMRQADGSLSLKGFGMRKQMFIQFNKDIRTMGKNVVYVAHEIEQKRGDETILRPEVGGSSANDLIKELDLVGYMEAYGKERQITFDPCDRFYAKNTCNLFGGQRIPLLIDDKGQPIGENNFMQQVISDYHARLRTNRELTARFESLVEAIKERVAAIETAKDANDFCDWCKAQQHVYNSRAVAVQVLQAKAKALGLDFDKSAKIYKDADPA